MDICNDRSDIEGDKVRIRLEGAPSDLHAAEAVWHLSCHKKFTNPKSILPAQKKKTKPNDLSAVNIIVKAIKNEPDRIWTLKEIHGKYLEAGGTDTHRSRFLAKITDELKSDIYVFKSIGLSPLLMHKKKASSMFAIVDSQEDEYCDYSDV